MPTWGYTAENTDDTNRLGQALADRLFPGAVIALVGPLGAGKTFLVQAVAESLGVDRALVASPTFVLIHEYPARIPVYHFDAYRLRNPEEFADLGADEYYAGDGVCLIEWADRVRPFLPEEHLEVQIVVLGATRRRFELKPYGQRYEQLLNELTATITDTPSRSEDPDRADH